MKISSISVFKTQDIGIDLSLLTVEGLLESKFAVPSWLECHALPGTSASSPPSSRNVSDVGLVACRVGFSVGVTARLLEMFRDGLSSDLCSCRLG